MADNWATSPTPLGSSALRRSLDLHLDLPHGSRGIGAALARALREAIRTGRLAPGTRLPSSRALAADLGVARNTVADVYAELVAEGWLSARQGSGTRVAQRATPRAARTARRAPLPPHPLNPRVTYNLMPGTPDVSTFPRAAWAAAVRRALTAAPSEAFGYQLANGRVELRRALAGYLARVRGVDVTPERVVLCSGFHQGLTLLARVLHARGARRVAMESYGLPHHRDMLTAAGLQTTTLPYDAQGTDPTGLTPRTHAVLLTPSHQFPTGVPLTPERRQAAIDWARRTGGLLLEDDYDGEFRYDRQPVGALQGLDPDHVVYLGTASKSLSPALRLGWMVVPERLLPEVLAAKGASETHSSVIDQLALAEFVHSGAYDRHIRAMRTRYRRRRDALVTTLATRAPAYRVTGISAGLHALLNLPPGVSESTALARTTREGLALSPLTFHTLTPTPPPHPALILGYAAPPDHLFPGALNALCRALT
ncbi:PLP-dependent aminotransferase family protein [Streptomyces sp. DSM 44917]|uniref:PLP-dependent aminotransferase family protein n=1 Tax=Streptomyces boetiae TaxID=3075541 RepID=A0ABU2LCI1_9ACTN|nr:PLP-dependent aminotransferase family protein [Streptomyces sp. DSM 44917]MDT0309279.1 PLP-dependent aminotransferase family protein [Streptomyces sp. DSM 44917]